MVERGQGELALDHLPAWQVVRWLELTMDHHILGEGKERTTEWDKYLI